MWFSDMLLDDTRTIPNWHLPDECYPSCSGSWKCCNGGTVSSSPPNAAAVQRCTAAPPRSRSDREHGKDLLRPTWRWVAWPSKRLAGSSSHSKVTEGWRSCFGIESNFKHVKHHVEIRAQNTGGKAFCSYEKCFRTFVTTKTLATSQQWCDSSLLRQEGFAGLLLHRDSEGAFQHCL